MIIYSRSASLQQYSRSFRSINLAWHWKSFTGQWKRTCRGQEARQSGRRRVTARQASARSSYMQLAPACHTRRADQDHTRRGALSSHVAAAQHAHLLNDKPWRPHRLFVRADRLYSCGLCPVPRVQEGLVVPADPFRLSPLGAHTPYSLSFPATPVARTRPVHSTNQSVTHSYTNMKRTPHNLWLIKLHIVFNSHHKNLLDYQKIRGKGTECCQTNVSDYTSLHTVLTASDYVNLLALAPRDSLPPSVGKSNYPGINWRSFYRLNALPVIRPIVSKQLRNNARNYCNDKATSLLKHYTTYSCKNGVSTQNFSNL